MSDRDVRDIERQEWLDSLEYVLREEGPERAREILNTLQIRAAEEGVHFTRPGNTPYLNSIPAEEQHPYPGSRDIERRIKSIIRWNAMAMVVRANRGSSGIGGHISTYASAATLTEVAFNHFLRGPEHENGGDLMYFQGHASPGMYARSFVEGRLTETDLANFRQELRPDGGLSSYPHPRLMPDYWQFPTVSMGLAPLQSIYQARFNKYLEDREIISESDRKVWAFLGDGEMDEPESMGALTLASREQLDNLIWVVNCNLQRLDGPVRGNGQVIQELESAFLGAGWNVIKVVWGADWDTLLEQDESGKLAQRMGELVDGQAQKYTVSSGDYIRKDFFGVDPELEKLVENYSDEQLEKLRRGGHDPLKVYNAFAKAMEAKDVPTVVLAQTIKGYGLGEAGEGRNVTHQQKKLNEQELRTFRSRFGIPVSDEQLAGAPFYRPKQDSEELQYMLERRNQLGGFLPSRSSAADPIEMPADEHFSEFYEGSGDRDVATTMVAVQILSKLLKDKNVGELLVPIVPDESRTFGMEALFRQVGIYSHVGQLYEPVDKESLMYYKEAKNGAILEEGISEAGCMSSFIAAGTAYASHNINMIPFFIFYSMFGFQRVGDLIWAAADVRARGFMIGGTAGRTTLPGEGLQHADGHSHHLALSVPSIRAYDPAYAYELAVIIRDGFKRMYVDQADLIYYITVMNETYTQPPMPEDAGVEEGILRGMYRFRKGKGKRDASMVHLFGSGAITNECVEASEILTEELGITADVWSVTSYKELYTDCIKTDRFNRLNPDQKPRKSFLEETLDGEKGCFIAASDYMRTLPLSISDWLPGELTALGTDGFGRSDNRGALRDLFEVDAKHIALAAVYALFKDGKKKAEDVRAAVEKLEIDPAKEFSLDV